MSLLDSVLGGLSGKQDGQPEASPMVAIISTLLTQSGGLQGLMNKFSQAGLGQVFSSWVSTGPNPPVSGSQIQQVLGSDQLRALASQLGIDPAKASEMLAQHLPNVVDRLTPTGAIDPNAHGQEGLAALIPSLLQQFTSGGSAQPQRPV
ncbi:MAG: YidB family protein [Chthoniobacterales bacterium]